VKLLGDGDIDRKLTVKVDKAAGRGGEGRCCRRDRGGLTPVLSGFQNIARVPELKRRILMTGLLLVVYRIGIHIPTPGINNIALKSVFDSQAAPSSADRHVLRGALARFSIFTLGIMPYISASIILQLLTVVIPQLEKLSKEGELGRRKITQYTRYGPSSCPSSRGWGSQWAGERDVRGAARSSTSRLVLPSHDRADPDLRDRVPDVAGEQITERGSETASP